MARNEQNRAEIQEEQAQKLHLKQRKEREW